MGKIDFGGVLKRVCLEYIPEVAVGEYAIIHVGFALNRLDEAEAQSVFARLKEAGELDQSDLEPDGGRDIP